MPYVVFGTRDRSSLLEPDRAQRRCRRAVSGVPSDAVFAAEVVSVEDAEQAILAARERTNCGPMQLQYLHCPHGSTIWRVLHRHGVSRRRRSAQRQTHRRYE